MQEPASQEDSRPAARTHASKREAKLEAAQRNSLRAIIWHVLPNLAAAVDSSLHAFRRLHHMSRVFCNPCGLNTCKVGVQHGAVGHNSAATQAIHCHGICKQPTQNTNINVCLALLRNTIRGWRHIRCAAPQVINETTQPAHRNKWHQLSRLSEGVTVRQRGCAVAVQARPPG